MKATFKRKSKIKKTDKKWIIRIILWSFAVSVSLGLITSGILPYVSVWAAILVLIIFIIIGILFDIIGIAVAAGTEQPFHSMSSRRVNGAAKALYLIRNAEKVSNLCNDVIGDISGIISGAITALIVFKFGDNIYLSLGLTGLVAALTIGGKGIGKGFALRYANEIIYRVALLTGSFDKKIKREKI